MQVNNEAIEYRKVCIRCYRFSGALSNPPESERDLKSHAMRSKLLSLHLVLTVLNSHMTLFVDPSAIIYSSSSNEATSFVLAINQYLCLSLSRNAVSPVPQVFEISVEIFWRVLSGMRTKLKVDCACTECLT
jgi:brefeldin A-inhibited guanine nucleotide-exchange protein